MLSESSCPYAALVLPVPPAMTFRGSVYVLGIPLVEDALWTFKPNVWGWEAEAWVEPSGIENVHHNMGGVYLKAVGGRRDRAVEVRECDRVRGYLRIAGYGVVD